MSTALAPGVAPGALVPGDPAGPRALARRLDAYADSAAAAAGQLRALDAGGWVGEAAEAFRQALGQVPERLERAVSAFTEAASALCRYASTLEEAQQRAGLALARVEAAAADTAAWRGRLAAEDLLESARADVEAAARAAAERLERAAADAPDQPGFWASAWHAAGQFVAGAAEASLELGELVFTLNPTYALTNPQGFVEHVVGLGQGAVYGATHRAEFAKAIVNWDLWLDNPARALGQLVPDLVLAVGTAGGGLAARGARGASRAGKSTKALNKTASAGRLPHTDRNRGPRPPESGAHFVDEMTSDLSMGRNSGVRVVGSTDELDDLFTMLSKGGSRIESSYPGRVFQLPDGTTVGRRGASRSGGPAIDIKMPDGRTVRVHVQH